MRPLPVFVVAFLHLTITTITFPSSSETTSSVWFDTPANAPSTLFFDNRMVGAQPSFVPHDHQQGDGMSGSLPQLTLKAVTTWMSKLPQLTQDERETELIKGALCLFGVWVVLSAIPPVVGGIRDRVMPAINNAIETTKKAFRFTTKTVFLVGLGLLCAPIAAKAVRLLARLAHEGRGVEAALGFVLLLIVTGKIAHDAFADYPEDINDPYQAYHNGRLSPFERWALSIRGFFVP